MANASLQTAIAHHQSGRLDEAEALYAQILKKDRYNADALHLLGLVRFQTGDHEGAVEPIQKAIRHRPGVSEYHNNLAGVLVELRRYDEALTCCRQSLVMQPDAPVALLRLGLALQNLDRLDEAIEALQRAVQLAPDFAEAHDTLGMALCSQQRYDEALQHHRVAMELQPDWDAATLNYATTLNATGDHAAAVEQFTRASRLIMNDLGEDADPEHIERAAKCLFNLANCLRDLGDFRQSLNVFRQAVNVQPELHIAWCNMIYLEQFLPGVSLQKIADLHAEWEREAVRPLVHQFTTFENSRDPDRRIRLGVISPNMRHHPAAFLTVRVFEALDREQFELCIYSDCTKRDDMTELVESMSDRWVETRHLDDEQLAERIHNDQVDVLIVMAGHTENNRLLVPARKAAPIQISWTGDPSGLTSVDFLIADRFVVPETHDPFYAESVLRMPHAYATFAPPAETEAIGPVPAEQNQFVTFGCFNQAIKYHSNLLQCWTRILQGVPDSRLLLIGRETESFRERLLSPFQNAGIATDRIELQEFTPRGDLLAAYNRVDVALDPFPFSGGVTTLEALWMGVPVVCLPGESFAGRTSLTYLANLGLDELLATDEADYVHKSIELASDEQRLAEYRSTLRQHLSDSTICDGSGFARALESQLREKWKLWCQT